MRKHRGACLQARRPRRDCPSMLCSSFLVLCFCFLCLFAGFAANAFDIQAVLLQVTEWQVAWHSTLSPGVPSNSGGVPNCLSVLWCQETVQWRACLVLLFLLCLRRKKIAFSHNSKQAVSISQTSYFNSIRPVFRIPTAKKKQHLHDLHDRHPYPHLEAWIPTDVSTVGGRDCGVGNWGAWPFVAFPHVPKRWTNYWRAEIANNCTWKFFGDKKPSICWGFLAGCWKNMVGFLDSTERPCKFVIDIVTSQTMIHRLQWFFTNLLHLVVNDEHEDCGGIICSMSLW